MVVEVEGVVHRFGTGKKGNNYVGLLVKRPDGQSDPFTVFTKSIAGLKVGATVKYKVNVYVQIGQEAST
jgi:hypothetical protein